MGGTQSANSNSITVKQLPKTETYEAPLNSGVRFTSNIIPDFEKQLQGAYDSGKEEGRAAVIKSFDLVAAQAYDHMRAKLVEIQLQSVQKSEKLVNDQSDDYFLPLCIMI